jgi:hypothetical protein
MDPDDYDTVPVDTASGAKNSIRFADSEDFSNKNITAQPSSGYKTLDTQKRDSPNAYAKPLTKSQKYANSGGDNRKNKTCATIRIVLLCKFVLFAIVLSMAALATAVMSVAMVTHQIAECKGQVEKFCGTITGGQNNIGILCGMVDNWNDTTCMCNCTAMDINMTSYP